MGGEVTANNAGSNRGRSPKRIDFRSFLPGKGRPGGGEKGKAAFKFRDRRVAYIFCSLTSPNTRTYFYVLLNFTSLLKGPSFNRHRLTSIDRSSTLSAAHLAPYRHIHRWILRWSEFIDPFDDRSFPGSREIWGFIKSSGEDFLKILHYVKS